MAKLPRLQRNLNRLKDIKTEDVRKFLVGPNPVKYPKHGQSRWQDVGTYLAAHPDQPAIVVTLPPELDWGWQESLRAHVMYRVREAAVVYRLRQQRIGDGMLVIWLEPDPDRTAQRQRIREGQQRGVGI